MIVSYRVPQYQYLLYAEPASVIPASEASCGMGCRGLLLVVLCYLLPGGYTAGGGCKASGEVKVDALNVLGRVGVRMIHDSL